jgi:hypothetical protein
MVMVRVESALLTPLEELRAAELYETIEGSVPTIVPAVIAAEIDAP